MVPESTFITDFANFYKDETRKNQFTDVSLQVEDQTAPVHKVLPIIGNDFVFYVTINRLYWLLDLLILKLCLLLVLKKLNNLLLNYNILIVLMF